MGAKAKQVKVRIAAGHVVYVDGRARDAGQVLELPAAEAEALVEQGAAAPLGKAGKGEKPPT